MKRVIILVTAMLVIPGLVWATSPVQYDLPEGAAVPTSDPTGVPPQTRDEVIYLDADTPETGANLETQPLETPCGTITFIGEVRSVVDQDMLDAGAAGDGFDILNTPDSWALMSFDFDVGSVSFLYGGNIGGIYIEARDINGEVLDWFYQEDTYENQPVGPETLEGCGIRSLYWEDPGGNYAILDNMYITCGMGPSANETTSWGCVKSLYR